MGIPIPEASPSCLEKSLQRQAEIYESWLASMDSLDSPPRNVDAALAHHRSEQPPANNAHPYRHLHDDDDDDDDEEDDDEEEEDERDGVFSVYDEEEEAWVDPTGGVLTRLTRLAVVNQFDEIASMLPTLNKDVLNLTGDAGFTALHMAAMAGNVEIVKLLLEWGADPSVQSIGDDGLAIHEAVSGGHLDCATVLVHAAPWTVHAEDLDGETPLHRAAREENPEMVHFLLSHGANPNKRTKFGVAVLDLALEGSCGATIRLLRHAGIMGWGRGTGSAAASIL